jgi:diaminohydroxyphosphoribosylaminopyrimidine deaminase/5-amino-6-(5-phosphoribosylamino)uracil reductase
VKSLTNTQTEAAFIDWPVYMQRAIDLAGKVMTATPNPRVGCVIVNDNAVVGEGWHVAAGQPHAEVMALEEAGTQAKTAIAFVSLEPCSHTGRTGPCSEALIAAGVSSVVVAGSDPNPSVAGKGIEKLEAAGIDVFHLADFEQTAREVNPGYFKRRESGLPFVRLKLAMSLDGRTALASGESKWITGKDARADVQRLRAISSAVITGVNTVLMDDPAMNVRSDEIALSDEEREDNRLALERQPLRIILDSQLRTPGTAQLIANHGDVKIYTVANTQAIKDLAENMEIVTVDSVGQRVNLQSVLESLASDFACNDVLVEAGPTLSGAFLDAGLVDELVIYIAPKILGSDARPLVDIHGLQSMSEAINFRVSESTQIGNDIRVTLVRDHSIGN